MEQIRIKNGNEIVKGATDFMDFRKVTIARGNCSFTRISRSVVPSIDFYPAQFLCLAGVTSELRSASRPPQFSVIIKTESKSCKG
jgi:hypothetical protein